MTAGAIGTVARRLRPWLWAGVAVMAVVLVLFSKRAPTPGGDLTEESVDAQVASAIASMQIPDFKLVDLAGKEVGREIFEGRWTILDFGFSNCTMACPVLKQNLATAVYKLRDTPVRVVTISVDPEHDTPLRLQEYAKELNVDVSRWTFLTESGGTPGEVRKIAVDSLGFMLQADPANQIRMPGGGTMDNIAHPTRFLVIGPDVSVRGMYRGNEPGEVQRMVEQLRKWTGAER